MSQRHFFRASLALLIFLTLSSAGLAAPKGPVDCNMNLQDCKRSCDGPNAPGTLTPEQKAPCLKECSDHYGSCVLSGGTPNSIGPINPTGRRHPVVGVPPSNTGTNKGPSGPAPKGGALPIASPPSSAGTNKGPSGGGTTTLEKSGGGNH
jgi:hypothetical protein